MSSDTPKTDELAKREFVADGIWIRHARELERENNQLRQNPAMNTQLTVALNALSKTYGPNTQLFALPKTEFDSTDTLIGAVLSEAGYDERPRNIINAFTWWGISVEEFAEILQSDMAFLNKNP